MSKHQCEHCGAKVAIAKICSACGNQHSTEWIANNKEGDRFTFFGMLILIPYIIFNMFTSSVLDLLIGMFTIIFVYTGVYIFLKSIFTHKKSNKLSEKVDPTL